MSTSRTARRASMFAALVPLLGACIPYAVGTTAMPVPRDSTVPALMVSAMPAFAPFDSTRAAPWIWADAELRRGIDSVSDFGLRAVNMYTGVVVNYKRLLTRTNEPALIAVMPGLGIINGGEHAHFELTLLASGRESRLRNGRAERTPIVPYGGLRIMQVAPLNADAVHDEATMGGFVGVRFGRATMGISPEVGVFHDRSALGMRTSSVVVVPTITIHGNELLERLRALGDVWGGRRRW